MNKLFDRLNLRPHERRLVVLVGLLLFVLVQVWWVAPHFGDWGKLQSKRNDHQRDIKRYDTEVAQRGTSDRRIAELRKAGTEVANEEQGLDLNNTVRIQANAAGIFPNFMPPTTGASNQFFIEKVLRINNIVINETNLVNFLYTLCSGDSLIRVSGLTLGPDQTRQKLTADITLVASYKRKAPPAATVSGGVAAAVSRATNSPGAATKPVQPTTPPAGEAPAPAVKPVKPAASQPPASAPSSVNRSNPAGTRPGLPTPSAPGLSRPGGPRPGQPGSRATNLPAAKL